MTLWLDVSDLRYWTRPHLSGIQRTVVTIGVELLRMRSDVQLFYYDFSTGKLLPTDGSILPPSIREQLLARPETPAPDNASRPRIRPRPSAKERMRRGAKALANRMVERFGNEETRVAMRQTLRGAKTLTGIMLRKLSALRRRMTPNFGSRLAASEASGLFQPGDICLSLSATWDLPGYGDSIALNKTRNVACVNLIYDLIPSQYPQWVPPGFRWLFDDWVQKQIVNADMALTISHCQKREIDAYIAAKGLPSRTVDVLVLGDNPPLLANADAPPPRHLPARDFIICVGLLDARKNQQCLYHAWRRLAQDLGDDCPQLLMIGGRGLLVGDLIDMMRSDPLTSQSIKVLHDVSDAELAWYYRRCLFTIFPSLYEGWGLPVAESIAAGRYCIASNSSSIPEAGSDFADYFDPIDAAECYRLVRRAIIDPAYVKAREARIAKEYRPRTWQAAARQVSDIADALARPSEPATDTSVVVEALRTAAAV